MRFVGQRIWVAVKDNHRYLIKAATQHVKALSTLQHKMIPRRLPRNVVVALRVLPSKPFRRAPHSKATSTKHAGSCGWPQAANPATQIIAVMLAIVASIESTRAEYEKLTWRQRERGEDPAARVRTVVGEIQAFLDLLRSARPRSLDADAIVVRLRSDKAVAWRRSNPGFPRRDCPSRSNDSSRSRIQDRA